MSGHAHARPMHKVPDQTGAERHAATDPMRPLPRRRMLMGGACRPGQCRHAALASRAPGEPVVDVDWL